MSSYLLNDPSCHWLKLVTPEKQEHNNNKKNQKERGEEGKDEKRRIGIRKV